MYNTMSEPYGTPWTLSDFEVPHLSDVLQLQQMHLSGGDVDGGAVYVGRGRTHMGNLCTFFSILP